MELKSQCKGCVNVQRVSPILTRCKEKTWIENNRLNDVRNCTDFKVRFKKKLVKQEDLKIKAMNRFQTIRNDSGKPDLMTFVKKAMPKPEINDYMMAIIPDKGPMFCQLCKEVVFIMKTPYIAACKNCRTDHSINPDKMILTVTDSKGLPLKK